GRMQEEQRDRVATKGERTRQALLEAAITRFARDGYRGASVAEIARDARLSGTAAYVYFPNKEALFIAAVDEDAAAAIEDGLSRRRSRPRTGSDPATRLGPDVAAVEEAALSPPRK